MTLSAFSFNQLDFAPAGYETPQGDQRGELRLSPLETPLPKGNPAARPRGIVKNQVVICHRERSVAISLRIKYLREIATSLRSSQ